MKMIHLTDTELQQYLTEPKTLGPEKTAHVLSCDHCAAKIANYRLLFQGIATEQRPAFDFDLSVLILEQLPEPTRVFPWFAVITGCISALIVAFSITYFWSTLTALAKGMSGMILPMTAVVAPLVLIIQSFELFRSYRQRMRTLLSEKTLQL